jgi:hypothetical protein
MVVWVRQRPEAVNAAEGPEAVPTVH